MTKYDLRPAASLLSFTCHQRLNKRACSNTNNKTKPEYRLPQCLVYTQAASSVFFTTQLVKAQGLRCKEYRANCYKHADLYFNSVLPVSGVQIERNVIKKTGM